MISIYTISLISVILSHSLSVSNNNICDLVISTDSQTIMENCEFKEEWLDVKQYNTDKNFKEIYESYGNKRRSFHVYYMKRRGQIESKTPLIILNITTSNKHKQYMTPRILNNNFPYILDQGDSFDFIIYYNCSRKWDEVQISLYINGELNPINIYYTKICTIDYENKKNYTYIILVAIFAFYIHFSRTDLLINKERFVCINIEEIAQVKHVEKIFTVTMIILFAIWFFILIGYIYVITLFFSFILSVISLKSLLKLILTAIFPRIMSSLTGKSFYFLLFKLDNGKILSYCISIVVYIIMYFFVNEVVYIILNNFIVFIMGYILIHKLNWRKLFFIISFYLLLSIYHLVILFVFGGIDSPDSTVYNLTTEYVIRAPIRFIIPDIIQSPFNTIYFFSLVDFVLMGFALRYLEQTKNFSNLYFMIGIYGSYLGFVINIISFYCFKFAPPFYLFPCTIVLFSAIGLSIYKDEFKALSDIDKQQIKKKTPFDVRLGIIGADHSDDYANISGNYLPPSMHQIREDIEINDSMDLKDSKKERSEHFSFSPKEDKGQHSYSLSEGTYNIDSNNPFSREGNKSLSSIKSSNDNKKEIRTEMKEIKLN